MLSLKPFWHLYYSFNIPLEANTCKTTHIVIKLTHHQHQQQNSEGQQDRHTK